VPSGETRELDPRDVLAAVIEHHGEKWLKFVLKVVRNPADAEDVLQEAVRRVLAHKHSFPSEDQVRMYLARAVSNMAIELYRSRKRERSQRQPIREHTIPVSGHACPDRKLEEKETSSERVRLLRIIEDGLSRLPVKQYEALRLTLLEPASISIREAGFSNGIPYSTLRHRSIAGLRRLRKFVHRALRSSASKLVLI